MAEGDRATTCARRASSGKLSEEQAASVE
jgi:hypothetical protein